jgi:excisionase family DNA binding protein
MTTYEMTKIAKLQAAFLVDAIKDDNDLADVMFPPKCLNIEEAAEYLRIPVSTLYNKIGEIPHEKVGKRLVFTDRGLMRWVKRMFKD